MKYVYITAKRHILEIIDSPSRPVNETPEIGSWVTFVTDASPVFDPATQVLVPAISYTATEVRTSFTIRDKTVEELATEARITAKNVAHESARTDNFVQNFIAMTPQEVATYVENNVNTLADAKAFLKKLSLMLLFVAKESFED
jgi:hypothetical protein